MDNAFLLPVYGEKSLFLLLSSSQGSLKANFCGATFEINNPLE